MADSINVCNKCQEAFVPPKGPIEQGILRSGPDAQAGDVHVKCLEGRKRLNDSFAENCMPAGLFVITLGTGILAAWGGARLFSRIPLRLAVGGGPFAIALGETASKVIWGIHGGVLGCAGGCYVGFLISELTEGLAKDGLNAWHKSHYNFTD